MKPIRKAFPNVVFPVISAAFTAAKSDLPLQFFELGPLVVSILASAPATVGASQALKGAVPIAGNHSPAASGLVALSAAPADQILEMRIVMSPSHRAELESLLREQQDRSSTQYHRWLKPGEFDSRFGQSASVRAAITSWLTQQGFDVNPSPNDLFAISFQGTVRQAETAFSISIESPDGGKHYANTNDPSVPSKFGGVIAFVDGLDNLRAGRSGMHVAPGSRARTTQPNAGAARGRYATPHAWNAVFYNGQLGFGPSDLYTFYDETPLLNHGVNGAGGGCIGLIEIGDYDPAAVASFDQVFNLPAPNIKDVISPNSDNPGFNFRSDETIFDLLYAHAIAPGARINIYLTDPATYGGNVIPSTVDSLNTAVRQDACSAISISIESCGFPASFYTGPLHTTYMRAASQGQTVFVAEGDQGAAEFQYNPFTGVGDCSLGTTPHVNELASDPYVTSVGGTQFNPIYDNNGNDVRHVSESVWNEGDNNGAGGGGRSVVFSKPFFQFLGTPRDGARDVPDVSMEAALLTPGVFPVFPDQNSGESVVCCAGGTSLGAPIWAGIAELLVQGNDRERIGTLNPGLYLLGASKLGALTGIRDVTMGDNDFNGVSGFDAVTGYDLASGWGTPDIANFVRAYLAISGDD